MEKNEFPSSLGRYVVFSYLGHRQNSSLYYIKFPMGRSSVPGLVLVLALKTAMEHRILKGDYLYPCTFGQASAFKTQFQKRKRLA